MNSMTGYAYKEVIDGDLQISVEIKSVNSRFLPERITVAERIAGHQASTSSITKSFSKAFR